MNLKIYRDENDGDEDSRYLVSKLQPLTIEDTKSENLDSSEMTDFCKRWQPHPGETLIGTRNKTL